MPEYLHPGVYIEEIPSGPVPIEGVSTSTAGFVGVTWKGPTTGKPVLVTSFADFTRRFGGFYPQPDAGVITAWTTPGGANPNGGRWWLFPHAVKAFFDNGGQRVYIKRVVPLGFVQPADPADGSPVPSTTVSALALDLRVQDFEGTDGGPGQRTGIAALEDIDEVAICAVPGMWHPDIHDELNNHCLALKERFAVLDVRDGLDMAGVQAARAGLSTNYAALYYPWLLTADPLTSAEIEVPPSGHAVGIYARVDVERGVHKAPANEVVRGVRGAAVDITAREQDILNPLGINAIRFFPGRGLRIWGARTLASRDDGQWKYISVRRLFIFLEESIEEATQWVVFEPNDEPTWARVRQSITNFLNTQWRNGALQGKTADQAFFVKCDYTTMTQDDIDNGRLICIIGVAPVKPAEFVIFRFMQKTLEAKA